MYKELTIENIKTFEKEQKLKIAPITLIYGENSTGKTTLLKTFDIVHNIFSPRSILAGKSTTGQDTEDMLVKSEDIKNISPKKLHFFASRGNKKPLKIELLIDLPYPGGISEDHVLFTDSIIKKYQYFEEQSLPVKGKGRTISRKTFGRSTYIKEKMADGSIRELVIEDTGKGSGKKKTFQVSVLGSSKIHRSVNKIDMVPVKFCIKLKYYPGLKLTKVQKIEIRKIDGKILVSLSRVARQYDIIQNKDKMGYYYPAYRKQFLSSLKEHPDFFTSSAGYADYEINVAKENSLWLRPYNNYEKIFSNDNNVKKRLNNIKLLFETLKKYQFVWLKNTEVVKYINWNAFSYLVTVFILRKAESQKVTLFEDLKNELKALFIYSDKNFPINLNRKQIDDLALGQLGAIIDKGDLMWEADPSDKSIRKAQLRLRQNMDLKYITKYNDEILSLARLFRNNFLSDLTVINTFLNKKVSFKKFCVENRNVYKDSRYRFSRIPSQGYEGSSRFLRGEISRGIINSYGRPHYNVFDILSSFSQYISGDFENTFIYRSVSGFKTKRGHLRRMGPQFLFSNCITEIKKTVDGFIACHPNKTEIPYDIPLESDFNFEEIYQTIGRDTRSQKQRSTHHYPYAIHKEEAWYKDLLRKYPEGKAILEQRWIRCEKCGWNYTLDEQDVKRYSVCPNCSKRATNPARGKYYIPDATLTTKTGKKIPIEWKHTVKKKYKKPTDFRSQPEEISSDGKNFDEIICNNAEIRKNLNKILKELLNLQVVVVTPKFMKKFTDDTYEAMRKGWDRGSYRNLWRYRKSWPKKERFIMLRDLSFNKYFSIHGREVGKGPANILPFLTQILSNKPNLTYLIQELENNWHPKYQAKIIELIVQIMKESTHKNFILETHSELFILQVKKLVQKGILKPEDVSINYISRSSSGDSKVNHIPLNSEGAFTKDWPGGFFTERVEVLTS